MDDTNPEKAARAVLEACADCDVCRFLMDTSCPFFPELYRLYDRELEGGEKATSQELRQLVDLCSFAASARARISVPGSSRPRLNSSKETD